MLVVGVLIALLDPSAGTGRYITWLSWGIFVYYYRDCDALLQMHVSVRLVRVSILLWPCSVANALCTAVHAPSN
jgi:hypothetical protein